MKKTIRILGLTAVLLLIVGAMLVGYAVIDVGGEQVAQWLSMPMYINHGEDGWRVSTLNYHKEPKMQVWEGRADELQRLRLDVVDADLELRAVEGSDKVRLTWYERYENEYRLQSEDGTLALEYLENTGVITFNVTSIWDADVPGFVLEYPADKEWLAMVLTGVDGEIRADEPILTDQISVDLVDGELTAAIVTGRFSLDGVDADVKAVLDSESIDFNLVDGDVELSLAGAAEDYRFDMNFVGAQFTLNGKKPEKEMNGDWILGEGAREVRISGIGSEIDVRTARDMGGKEYVL